MFIQNNLFQAKVSFLARQIFIFIRGKKLNFYFLQKIRNRAKTSYCVDSQEVDEGDKPIIGYPCHGQAGNQFFLMSKTFEIRREDKCLDYAGGHSELHKPGKVVSFTCHSMQGNQLWTYEVNSSIEKTNQRSIFVSFSERYVTTCIRLLYGII